MAQVINSNIPSLTAQRNLNGSQSAQNTAIQRLSSGLRINSAKDDAAGLAISERMNAQVRGLNVAARNAQDGISLAQTAEGAMGTIGNNLQRIRELSVQSANATNSAGDRKALQEEVNQLVSEIDRVASQTEFNGQKLLDGSFTTKSFQVGANAGQKIDIAKISSARTSDMGMSYSASVNGGVSTAALATGDLTINGAAIKASVAGSGKGQGADSAYAIAKAINESQSEVVAKANTTTATASAAITATAADFAINGVTIGATTSQAELLEKINANSAATGVSAATDASGFVKLSAADGRNIDITGAAPTGGTLVSAKSTLTLTANSGSTQGSGIVIAGAGVAKAGLTAGTTAAALTGTAISKIDISTAAGADDALKSLDAALGQINSERASLGAIQNRFDSVVSNLQTNAENLTASKSRIMDTDFAAETANLTRAQILQQAGTAMLAQANQLPQNVLSLLR